MHMPSSVDPAQAASRPRRLLPALFAAACFLLYLAASLYYNAFGPEAPLMMAFFDISEGRQGFILTLQAVGTLLASVYLALFGERHNKIYVVCGGMGTLALCALAIHLLPALFPMGSGYPALLAIVFAGGVGYTCIDLMINGVINDVYPVSRSTILPIMHAFYGTGSMLIPIFVSALVTDGRPETFATPYLAIAAATGAAAVFALVTGARFRPETPYADMRTVRRRVRENPAEIFREGRTWLFLLAFVLNFMLLCGISVWLVTYAQRALSLDYATASLLLTLFFGGALLMRFASPLIFRVLPVRRYVVLMPVLAALTLGAGFAIGSVPLLYVLLPLGGFFQGGLIGAMVLLCCESFPERSASAASLSSFAVGVSTLVTPALMGAAAERFGFTLPMIAICICMLLSALVVYLAIRAGRQGGSRTTDAARESI